MRRGRRNSFYGCYPFNSMQARKLHRLRRRWIDTESRTRRADLPRRTRLATGAGCGESIGGADLTNGDSVLREEGTRELSCGARGVDATGVLNRHRRVASLAILRIGSVVVLQKIASALRSPRRTYRPGRTGLATGAVAAKRLSRTGFAHRHPVHGIRRIGSRSGSTNGS